MTYFIYYWWRLRLENGYGVLGDGDFISFWKQLSETAIRVFNAVSCVMYLEGDIKHLLITPVGISLTCSVGKISLNKPNFKAFFNL